MTHADDFVKIPYRRALVLGGARSGKSAAAERLVKGLGVSSIYIATAQAWDGEMAERIARHREDRGGGWTTVDAPLELPEALRAADGDGVAERDVEAACAELLAAVGGMRAPVVMVSNEVGMGIVPDTPLGRRFRDAQGRLNQQAAVVCDTVAFVAAGLPLILKRPA
jgi:adenosylcobinamide kinase/adenosylcobinamide-phosphate guanylyltransferase